MAAVEKVSFTIRRPTPISRAPSSGPDSDSQSYKVPALPRHLANSSRSRSTTSSPHPPHEPNSSDDDDDGIKDELVTGFDRFGVQRVTKSRPTNSAPLIIPALKNRDWRELARKRRSAAQYVPPSAKAEVGADGSIGGLGTRDTINSGPVLSGLQLKRPPPIKQEEPEPTTGVIPGEDVRMGEEEDDEDKLALRAVLAGTKGQEHDGPLIDIIPTPVSETDAYKQDVAELPDAATLDDYARVPVSQFGAALLRGMGWKEGTAATRKPGKGLVEPYFPEARPALLGIGAKEMETLDDGSGKKAKRPEKRYVPLIKKERDVRPSSAMDSRDQRERSRSPRSRNGTSTTVSRRNSRSRERGSDSDHRRRETLQKRERDHRRDDRDRDYIRDSDRERRRGRSQDSGRRRRN